MIMKGRVLTPPLLDCISPSGNDIPLLLATKLNPPRLGRGILPRPRLERLAEQITEHGITVLKAPPGFGKTTLASIWADSLAAQGHAVAWLSLDEQDASVQRLLFYLAAALNHADPALGRGCLGLRAELTFFSMETLASLLINELIQFDRPLVLFIDDCQRISNPVLVNALRFFIQRAPQHLYLVLISRQELPAALLEKHYADDLLELDASHLRFCLEETRDLFRKASLELEHAGDLCAIQQESDGWVAALRAFLLTPQFDTGGVPRVASRSICLLFEELLNNLEDAGHEHLCYLSLLDKFSIGLASELIGAVAARQLVSELQRRQLFIKDLEGQDHWFTLHPLLRSYLKRRCLEQYPEAVQRLRFRAAQWFAAHRHWLDAIKLGLEAEQGKQVREWINQCALELLEQGDFNTLVMLEKRWKLEAQEAPLPLKMARVWAMGLALEVKAAEILLDELERDIADRQQEGPTSRVYWEMQALRAMLLGLADHNERSGELATRCSQAMEHRPWITNVLRNLMSCSHYHASRWDAFYSVPPTFSERRHSASMLFHDYYRRSIHALAECAQGRLQDAQDCLEDLLVRVDNGVHARMEGPNPALVALPNALLAQLHYRRGDHALTETYLARCMEYIALGGFLDCLAAAYCTQARLQWYQGAPARARRSLEQLDLLANRHGWPRLRARVLLERVWLNLQEHKSREAISCSHCLSELTLGAGSDVNLDARVYAQLSRLWLALCDLDEAPGLAEQSQVLMRELQQRQLDLMYCELASALGALYCLRGQPELGQPLLDEVLLRTQHSGAISVLQDLPLGLSCERLADCVTEQWRDAVDALFAATGQRHGQSAQACNAALLGLTVKERQVMQLVCEGKSNKQIARDLNVTPETIKSHMKSIFAKLKVDSRAQAAVMLQNGQTLQALSRA
ncbi:LuxR C-terminal-related transcriptional regulator [Halopseudomonas pelagia]|uniref:LuxR C-terminal-related transcriptional regulator n=1 Tax=Halopseudomonas pelagia TaxID=553151 RepID=UPI00039D68E2|nr:LuxR C-terminal-related transcriptional regulator [Halopseudomonas pelagia]